jgi:hypothetical protein
MISSFLTIAPSLPEIDWNVIGKIASQKPLDLERLDELRQVVIASQPELAASTRPADIDIEMLAGTFQVKGRSEMNEADLSSVHTLHNTLAAQFGNDVNIEHRISTPIQHQIKFARAGARALFDTVGFQVVPSAASRAGDVLQHLSKIAGWEKLFVFNTFPFSIKDFATFISPDSSPFYRAVHFYLVNNGVCAEIQVRLPFTHEWTKLHHATVYKPRVQISGHVRDEINRIGASANFLDYTDVLLKF